MLWQQVSRMWSPFLRHSERYMAEFRSDAQGKCFVKDSLFQYRPPFTYSLLPRQGRWTSSVDELNWLQVKNFCKLESEEEQVQIAATKHTVSTWSLAWLAVSGDRNYIYKIVRLSEQLCQ